MRVLSARSSQTKDAALGFNKKIVGFLRFAGNVVIPSEQGFVTSVSRCGQTCIKTKMNAISLREDVFSVKSLGCC